MVYYNCTFICFSVYHSYSLLHNHTSTHVVNQRLKPHLVLAFYMLVYLNSLCVSIESLLNICILLHFWFLFHLHVSSL